MSPVTGVHFGEADMTLPYLILFALVGLGVTLTLIPIIRRKTAVASAWTFHHTHKSPVSRFGGVALAVAFVVLSLGVFIGYPVSGERLETRYVVFFSALAMFLLGFADDLRPLGARKKLIAQVAIAFAVCCFGVRIENFQNPFTNEIISLGVWGWALTIFWLVALTNLINLIDGIDGLAGGIGMMMMALLAYVGMGGELYYPILLAAGMFGALMGFLFYNFPPAKIYMGDGGAYLLGYLIAILTLVHSRKGTLVAALIAPMFALALPILDATLAILRRGLRGLPIFRPDRKHLHHKLQEMGFSRTRTVLILYGFSAVCLVLALGVVWLREQWVPILFGFMCLTLVLSARSFRFSRDWFAVGRVLENSAELRKETAYALALGRWLELEAERAASVEELWTDYELIADKLGFVRVRLVLADGGRTWRLPSLPEEDKTLRCSHDLSGDGSIMLEFEGDANHMSGRLFEHLSELAAECWLKAAKRWQSVKGVPARFGSQDALAQDSPVAAAAVSPKSA